MLLSLGSLEVDTVTSKGHLALPKAVKFGDKFVGAWLARKPFRDPVLWLITTQRSRFTMARTVTDDQTVFLGLSYSQPYQDKYVMV